VVFNPNIDIVEDRQRLTIYNKKQLQMTHAKFMLSVFSFLRMLDLERVIFYYKYPRFSQFCLFLLIFFFATFDPGYLLSYILGLLIIIFVLLHEPWYNRVRNLFKRAFFGKVNPYFNEDRAALVKTFR
jgi:hypothetical protein